MLLKFIKLTLFSFVLVFCLSSFSMAATYIWSENFDSSPIDATKRISVDGVTLWESVWSDPDQGKNDHFSVQEVASETNKVIAFEGRDLDSVGTWTTGSILISGYTAVGISIDFYRDGTVGLNDYIEFLYSINGASFVPYKKLLENFEPVAQTISITGLTGDTLAIQIKVYNTNNARYQFDNVLVEDKPISPVPVPTSLLLLGSGIVGLIGFRRRKRQ